MRGSSTPPRLPRACAHAAARSIANGQTGHGPWARGWRSQRRNHHTGRTAETSGLLASQSEGGLSLCRVRPPEFYHHRTSTGNPAHALHGCDRTGAKDYAAFLETVASLPGPIRRSLGRNGRIDLGPAQCLRVGPQLGERLDPKPNCVGKSGVSSSFLPEEEIRCQFIILAERRTAPDSRSGLRWSGLWARMHGEDAIKAIFLAGETPRGLDRSRECAAGAKEGIRARAGEHREGPTFRRGQVG